MKLFLLLFTALLSACLFGRESHPEKANLSGGLYGDTLTGKKPMADTGTRFAYAEMYYSREPTNFDKITMWVAGDYVNEKTKKLIAEAKYRTWGLTYMGEDGWELVSTMLYVNPVTHATEYYFYFKKKLK